VFGRRSSASSESESSAKSGSAADDSAAAAQAAAEERASGKGRPTPTRKEAEEARKKRLAPARTRKEQAARQRERAKDQRARMRHAMDTGDERHLPSRDRGPVKRYVRNYVDSHRTVGEFLIPLFFLIFIMVAINNAIAAAIGTYAWITVLLAMIFDSVRMTRGVKKGIRERFGEAETKGITFYTLTRSWQMRRLRLPKPQVKPGDTI
jgi:hypothetical protein